MANSFLKKHGSTLLILLLIAVLLIPQTGVPIKVWFNRLLSFSPSVIEEEQRETLAHYQWGLETLDGTSVNFNTSKGRVAIVNFWATWCPPCLAEMPSLQNLYDAYGDRVDFYLVSHESKEVLEAFLKKKAYTLPIYVATAALPAGLETQSLPTTYLIAKDGKIVVKKTGAAQWDSDKIKNEIEALLQE